MGWVMCNGIRVHIQDGSSPADYHGLITQAAADMIQFRATWGDDEYFSISRNGGLYTMRRVNGEDEILMGPVVSKQKKISRKKDRQAIHKRMFLQPVFTYYQDETLIGWIAGYNGTFSPPYSFIPYNPNFPYDPRETGAEYLNGGYEDNIRGLIYLNITISDEFEKQEEYWEIDPFGNDYITLSNTGTIYAGSGTNTTVPKADGTPIAAAKTITVTPFDNSYDTFEIISVVDSNPSWTTTYCHAHTHVDSGGQGGGGKWQDTTRQGQYRNVSEYGALLGESVYTHLFQTYFDFDTYGNWICPTGSDPPDGSPSCSGWYDATITENADYQIRSYDHSLTWKAYVDGEVFDVDFSSHYHTSGVNAWDGPDTMGDNGTSQYYRADMMGGKKALLFYVLDEHPGEDTDGIVGIVVPDDKTPVKTYSFTIPDYDGNDVLQITDWAIPPPDDLPQTLDVTLYGLRLFVYSETTYESEKGLP